MIADLVIRSSAIVLIGLLVMPLLRRQSAALRHWILFMTLVSAAVVPLAARLMPEWTPVPVAVVPPAWMSGAPASPPVATSAQADAAPPASAPAAGVVPRSVSDLLWQGWIVGAALSLLALAIGLVRLRRVDADAAHVGGPWAEILAQRHQSGPDGVSVRATARPGLLLVWGVRRPTIIIPDAASTWSRPRIRAVLDHELAHIRRHDWSTHIVTEVVRAMYWFNPLVWIACARLRAECEAACDDAVIDGGTAGSDYAAHVVAVAREMRTQFWLPAPAIAGASTLERRVRAMLDQTLDRRPVSARRRGSAVAIIAVLTLAVAAIAAQSFVSLSGTISDASNGVLPGVKLILTNEQTGAKYEIQSDRTGRYEFVGLPPGDYTMAAALPGFARISGRVSVGAQNLQQDLTMSIGMIEETITVRRGAVLSPPDPELMRKLEEAKQKRAQMAVAAQARCDAAAKDGVRMGGNIRVPIKLRDFRPSYPEPVKDEDGTVVLKAQIATNGSVDDVQVISSTHAEFTQSAIDAVRQWEFDATLLNCERITTPMRVSVFYKAQ